MHQCKCGNGINSPYHEVCRQCAEEGDYECASCGRGMHTDIQYCDTCSAVPEEE